MASAQCWKPAEQTCGQGQQKHSFGQTVSEMSSWAFKKEESSQTNCCRQNEANLLGQTTGRSGANGVACKGKNKKKGENRRKGLLEKIKDGISRLTDSSSSSSSSESDSDDEKRRRNKN